MRLKKVKLNVNNLSKSWSEITFREYKEILKNSNSLDSFKTASIMTGISEEDLKDMKLVDYEYILSELQFLNKTPNFEKYGLPKTIKYKDKVFSIPNNLENESVQRYETCKVYMRELQDETLSTERQIDITYFIACIYLMVDPEKGKFEEEANKAFDFFKDIPYYIIFNFGTFFLNKLIGLKKDLRKRSKPSNLIIRMLRKVRGWI